MGQSNIQGNGFCFIVRLKGVDGVVSVGDTDRCITIDSFPFSFNSITNPEERVNFLSVKCAFGFKSCVVYVFMKLYR